MATELEEKIEKEIEQYKQKYGEVWGIYFFNNFDGNLVGGHRRTTDINQNRKYHIDDERYSMKKRDQTWRELCEECDKVVIESGLTFDEIIDARIRVHRDGDLSLFELLIPVYIKLREAGYKHYPDLTA